jgi:hypothetical protein
MKPIKLLWVAALMLTARRPLFAWDYQAVVYEANSEDRSAGYGTIKSYRQMQHLKDIGVNALSFSPVGYQKSMTLPEITFDGALEEGLERDILTAKKLGMKIILQPVLEPFSIDDSFVPNEPIAMRSEEEWRRWFANYQRMIVYFAATAERLNVDLFVIGAGYDRATRNRDAEWCRIIRSVRAVYRGSITYAAAGFEEAQRIHFWNDLDMIGLNTAFRLSSSDTPSDEELRQSWAGYRTQLALLSKQNADRPVLLTELGYSGVNGVAQRPMAALGPSVQEDRDEQARCYDAALSSLENTAWLQGIVLWKYKISVTPLSKTRVPSDFYAVFQNHPAEEVIRGHFFQKTDPVVR